MTASVRDHFSSEVDNLNNTKFQIEFTTRIGEQLSGPLATLWRLIESYEVDIFEVSLSRITEDFLRYMTSAEIALEDQADFALMAAKLIYYKSKMLLPNPGFEEEQDVDVLPLELVEQLLEYKRYQQAAESLRALEERARLSFGRKPSWHHYEADIEFLQVDLLSFLKAFREFLDRKEREQPMQIEEEEVGIEDMMELLRQKISLVGRVSFFAMAKHLSIIRCIVLFLAVLELVRLREINVTQSEQMTDIVMVKYERPRESQSGN